MQIVQLSEPEYCEDVDEHPGVLAVAMDTDFGAYWCQACVNYYNSDEWLDSGEDPLECVAVQQPEGVPE